MNIKGDSMLNNYNCIIITSIQKLQRIYGNVPDELRKQWERRIEVIDMFPPEPVHLGGYPLGYRTFFNQLEEYEVTDDWDSTRTIYFLDSTAFSSILVITLTLPKSALF
eukprot:jgi/Orpsp1_1/1178265/evm.model.c7180000064620.1